MIYVHYTIILLLVLCLFYHSVLQHGLALLHLHLPQSACTYTSQLETSVLPAVLAVLHGMLGLYLKPFK